MLPRPSNTLAYYFACLSMLHEHAKWANDGTKRASEEATSERWKDLAAAAARAEHVDLFLQSLAFKKVPPMEICLACYRRMSLTTIETTNEGEKFTFECWCCGSQKVRQLHNH